MKKSSRGEFNFENIMSRFCGLSYFDQHHITSTVASQVGCKRKSLDNLTYLSLTLVLTF